MDIKQELSELQEMMKIKGVNFKPISDSDFRKFKINPSEIKKVSTIEELRNGTPNMIVTESVANTTFIQNNFKKQNLIKKKKYVMSLGVYSQLHYEINRDVRILKPTKPLFKNIYKPYLGQNLNGKTLLVWRTGGIGDLLFINPNLRFLKEKYPDCTIKFACGPQYQSMVETWDFVDKVLDLPFNIQQVIMADYHAMFEGVIERCEAAEKENAYRLFTKWLNINLPDELLIPKQEPREDKVKECYEILDREWGLKGNDFILLQLRASSPIRTPRPEFSQNLINLLTDRGHNVVITDGPHKYQAIEDLVMNFVKDKNKVFNFANFSKTLDYTIALTSLAKVVVSTDSALIHVAQSLGIPAFGIYGPFLGRIRLETYKNVDWIDAPKNCCPCFLHGHMPCKHSKDNYPTCFDTIDLRDVVNRVEKLMI